MTPELVRHIKESERLVLHPYLDPVGLPTIGYGHRIPDMDHPTLTVAQAEALLLEDIAKHEEIALRLSPGLKDEPARRLDAITDFCFNLGGGRYAGSVLRLRVNQKRWDEAAKQIERWVYGKNRKTGKHEVLDGLVKRRAIEAHWLLHPTDESPAAA